MIANAPGVKNPSAEPIEFTRFVAGVAKGGCHGLRINRPPAAAGAPA